MLKLAIGANSIEHQAKKPRAGALRDGLAFYRDWENERGAAELEST